MDFVTLQDQLIKAINSKHYLLSVTLQRQNAHWSEFPFCLPVIKHLNTLEFHPKITFIIGENGSGKSTLLEAIAAGLDFNPEGGSRNFHFATKDTHSDLHNYLVFHKGIKRPHDGFFLRAESFYNVATEIDHLYSHDASNKYGSYGGESLHNQSHGEAFLSLIKYRFGRNGLYILDEPEAALSPNRQLTMLALLHKHILNGSQFIIATHSPILLSYPDAKIFSIGATGLQPTNYEDTPHFQVMHDFIQNKDRILYELFKQ